MHYQFYIHTVTDKPLPPDNLAIFLIY